MSFGFGISDFEYVFDAVLRIRNFVKSIKDAPKDFDAFRAEADSLQVCLKVLRYKECRNVLEKVSSDQAQDLRTIVYGCLANMEELIGFVAKCQLIAVDSSGIKQGRKTLSQLFVLMGKQLWAKVQFAFKDKQPMREKLAIPTQSLNIYLTSLTFVSLPYNGRLYSGPVQHTANPPEFVDWDIIGRQIAFKNARFTYSELAAPGIEDTIVEYALRIIQDRNADSEEVTAPKPLGRKPSVGGHVRTTSDRMFLVRPKKSGRSKSVTRPTLEIVKADYEFEGSGSDGEVLENDYLSPRDARPPLHRSPREVVIDYEERAPRPESSARHESFREGRESHSRRFENEDEEAEERYLHQAEENGYRRAREEIKSVRKAAVKNIKGVLAQETRRSRESIHPRNSRERDEPDVRAYMEVTYGVIVERTTPEVENIRATESHESAYTRRAAMSERLREAHTERKLPRSVCDSDVSDDEESDSEIEVRLSSTHHRRESRSHKESRPNLCSIPFREYSPRTEGFEGRHLPEDVRDRERAVREREMSLREREISLRDRELNLMERERRRSLERERSHSMRRHETPQYYDEGPPAPPIIVEGDGYERPNLSRYEEGKHSHPEDLHGSRGGRRPSHYGPHIEIVRPDDSENGSTYGRSERERR